MVISLPQCREGAVLDWVWKVSKNPPGICNRCNWYWKKANWFEI